MLITLSLLSIDNKGTLRAMKRKTPAPTKPRLRRARTDIRQQLLDSALVEFGAKGFDGASTRSIAQRVDAHQPQINYHFASKEALWAAPVAPLFGLLGEGRADLGLPAGTDDPAELASAFAEAVR